MWHHVGNDCGIIAWDHGTWDMGNVVLRCEMCIVPIHLHFPLLLLLQDPFLSVCAL